MHLTALELSIITEALSMNIDSMFKVLLDPQMHINQPGAESTRYLYIEELKSFTELRDKTNDMWWAQMRKDEEHKKAK